VLKFLGILAGGQYGFSLRYKVVATIARGHLDCLTHYTELGNIFFQYDFHRKNLRSRMTRIIGPQKTECLTKRL
jgi:hypothetical protein